MFCERQAVLTVCGAVLYVRLLLAEGVSRKKKHVTHDKREMRGYDWLFSDVTESELSQLETITRCLVTSSVSSPLLYPSRLSSLCLPSINISAQFASNFLCETFFSPLLWANFFIAKSFSLSASLVIVSFSFFLFLCHFLLSLAKLTA